MAKAFSGAGYIPAYWYSSNNFGDALTPWLIHRLSNGRPPVLVGAKAPTIKAVVTGSIASNEIPSGVVWGAGVANVSDNVYHGFHSILAVRGFLTLSKIKTQGLPFEPLAVGDPALLLDSLFPRPKNQLPIYKIGVLPHYADAYHVWESMAQYHPAIIDHRIKILDINLPAEDFIRQLWECEAVISSTLHGIIACHSYGIPCLWAKFSNNVIGDGYKFHDHYSVVGVDTPAVLDLRGMRITPDALLGATIPRAVTSDDIKVNLLKLLESCPFFEGTEI